MERRSHGNSNSVVLQNGDPNGCVLVKKSFKFDGLTIKFCKQTYHGLEFYHVKNEITATKSSIFAEKIFVLLVDP